MLVLSLQPIMGFAGGATVSSSATDNAAADHCPDTIQSSNSHGMNHAGADMQDSEQSVHADHADEPSCQTDCQECVSCAGVVVGRDYLANNELVLPQYSIRVLDRAVSRTHEQLFRPPILS